MSRGLDNRAETLMLSRLLEVDADQLAYLDRLDPEAVRELRLRVTDVLFDADRGMMRRLAAGAAALPAGVVATIGEKVFGALLCARIAGRVEPGKARAIAAKLDPRFLADVSVEIDPRRASDVIAAMPPAQSAAVAAELTRRRELVTMGRFVAHLRPEAIAACLEVIPDSELLEIAFVVEEKERLEGIVAMLPSERRAAIIRHAASDDHAVEAFDLIDHLSDELTAEIAEIAAGEDDDVLTALVDAADELDLWESLLGLTGSMSEPSRRRFAGLEAMHRPGTLAAIVRAAVARDLWAELAPLVPLLPEQAQSLVAREVAALDDEALGAIIAAAGEQELWPTLVGIGTRLDPDAQAEIAKLMGEADEQVLRSLLAAMEEAGMWEELTEVAGRMPPEHVERLFEAARGMDLLERLGALEDSGGGARGRA